MAFKTKSIRCPIPYSSQRLRYFQVGLSQKIGILGGGQLGRMTAMAAHRLGIETLIYDPDAAHSPAGQVSPFIQASWEDKAKLAEFANQVDVITYEFENIPLESVHFLASLKPLYPDAKALDTARDRIKEKQFIANLGIAVAPFAILEHLDDLASAFDKIQGAVILKTARLGYDGHGQIALKGKEDIHLAQDKFKTTSATMGYVLEKKINLALEASILLVRKKDGNMDFYPPSLNEHRNHILHKSTVPANLKPEQVNLMLDAASKIAIALDYCGLLAIEFFIDDNGNIMVNEMAPRPHNSGHWTMDGAASSQFEQLVRAICDLPLGNCTPLYPNITMLNLLGDDIENSDEYLKDPSARLHLYGKKEIRAGRKMGHVNFITQ